MGSEDRNRRYPEADFVEPSLCGYVYAGIRADPPGRMPFVRRSEKREKRISEVKAIAKKLKGLDRVIRVTVFRAVLIPPVKGTPRFDVMLLVTTTSPDVTSEVRDSETFTRLETDFVMSARNIRRIGDTEAASTGTFLFNHFTAPDSERALRGFEKIAAWYTDRIGVDNSTVLQPVSPSPYAFVNYVHLPSGPVKFVLDQFTKPSFYSFVPPLLRENGMAAMPVLCEPVK